MSKYKKPEEVTSPRRNWSLTRVLEDNGPDNVSLALGKWDEVPVLAMRWNGSDENPIGNPQSRGLPTWFILPRGKYTEMVIATLSEKDRDLVRTFIPVATKG